MMKELKKNYFDTLTWVKKTTLYIDCFYVIVHLTFQVFLNLMIVSIIYIFSAMLFSDKGVDPNLISWNRVVLLHGPPGIVT